MNLYLNLVSIALKDKSQLTPLYPYQSQELVVLFVYGNDFKWQRLRSFLDSFGLLFFNWFNFCIFAGAICLFLIRRIIKLRGDGLFSSFIDVLVTFTGGGNLVINRHRLEVWFFVTIFIASFFLNAIGLQSSLYLSYVDVDHRIATFAELAEINPPIFVSPTLKDNANVISEMLKFAFELNSNENIITNGILFLQK